MTHLQLFERGDGIGNAPVVALHSGGLSGRQWSRLVTALATDHRVIAPNLIGYPGSEAFVDDREATGRMGEPFSYHRDAEAIAELLGTLGAPAHLVGHSYGGLVALRVALTNPELVRSLALFEPVAMHMLHSANDVPGLEDLGSVGAASFLDAPNGGDAAWLTQFVDWWSGDGAFAALGDDARASWLAVGRKVYVEVQSLLKERMPAGSYAGVQAPALILSGERSRVAARRVAAMLGAELPRGRHVEIPGAGHMGPLTHGAQVNDLIAAHVRANDA